MERYLKIYIYFIAPLIVFSTVITVGYCWYNYVSVNSYNNELLHKLSKIDLHPLESLSSSKLEMPLPIKTSDAIKISEVFGKRYLPRGSDLQYVSKKSKAIRLLNNGWFVIAELEDVHTHKKMSQLITILPSIDKKEVICELN